MRNREILENLKLAGIPAPEQLCDYWDDDEEHQSVEAIEFFLAHHAAGEWLFEHEIPELPTVLDQLGIERTHPETVRMHQAIESLIVERDLRQHIHLTHAQMAYALFKGADVCA